MDKRTEFEERSMKNLIWELQEFQLKKKKQRDEGAKESPDYSLEVHTMFLERLKKKNLFGQILIKVLNSRIKRNVTIPEEREGWLERQNNHTGSELKQYLKWQMTQRKGLKPKDPRQKQDIIHSSG